jgi:hypothetical protein
MPEVKVEILDVKGIKDSIYLLRCMLRDRPQRGYARLGFTVEQVCSPGELPGVVPLQSIYEAFEKENLMVWGIEVWGALDQKLIGVAYVPMLACDVKGVAEGKSLQEYLGLSNQEIQLILDQVNNEPPPAFLDNPVPLMIESETEYA